jgi:hypothetical protein
VQGSPRDDQVAKAVETAFTNFWEVYGVVQTVADTRLVEAARIYACRLWELAASLGSTSVMGSDNFRRCDSLRDLAVDQVEIMLPGRSVRRLLPRGPDRRAVTAERPREALPEAWSLPP